MMLVPLMVLFLSGCGTADQARLDQSARTTAQAGQVGDAITAARALPDQPADCRRTERSGVQPGDRLDVALVKTDQALGRANQRTTRCADWYATLQAARGGSQP